MRKGKPYYEAEVIGKRDEEATKKKLDGDWCDCITPSGDGFICLEDPSLGRFEEPCTGTDMSNCYLLKDRKGPRYAD